MAKYVDGYVLVVPKKNFAAYKKMARQAGKLWMKHGALSYKECIAEELKPNVGDCLLPFSKMVKLKPGETVWFSYIEYKSKAQRNRVNKKVMEDMQAYLKEHPEEIDNHPFDMKRMAFAGFEVVVDA